MPFDPNLPLENTEIDAVQMRGQLNGLKELIDAISGIDSAVIDAVNTTPPGGAAGVSLSVVGNTLHFVFDLPQGNEGPPGAPGTIVGGAQVDSVTTLDPGQAATAGATFDGSLLHFSFGIPRGADGTIVSGAVVDSVTTLDPGQPATADVSFDGSVLHFSFGIPRGADGA